MRCNIFAVEDISLFAKDVYKTPNNIIEHKILTFRRNNIWLVCHADFFLVNLPCYFANGWDSGRASTKDSSMILPPGTSTIF